MNHTRKVILITDGDEIAKKVVEEIAKQIGGRCITASGGNPTPISGTRIVDMILSTPYDPVLVMFDDNGHRGFGRGERALKYVVEHPRIEVLGLIAVASNSPSIHGAWVDYTIDFRGKVTKYQIDKNGHIIGSSPYVMGDTLDYIRQLRGIPLIIGIGDIGKMKGKDSIKIGAPITKKAIQMILERSGLTDGTTE